ncbi:hypothetical protein [Clostridium psychrophilum]|uniref:hypothetical protein n=1 Tax=Clostridium psychrophilum TaxID=132926 RepID=UPI001C0C4DA1|nr:hypothetical protein [Clostridium psychrophilum]MBU3179979.1 hypothetical protein [Clostridium psychrophilum]
MLNNIKKGMIPLILISLSIFSGFLGTITVMAEKNNNIMKSSAVNISRDKLTDYEISKEKGLEIVKSKVRLEPDLHILYDSERNIKGVNYHLYTVNTNEYTYDEYAYCVDVNSGKLFKCLKDMTLLPIG